jgi:integrase/recombinase XerD
VFETLFKYPRVFTRHRAGPSAERFLNHCVSQGLARATVLRHARELLVIAERIDITMGETIDSAVIEAAADRWAREQHDRQRVQVLQWSQKLFVQTATNWLRFLGRLESRPKVVPFADRLADFAAYQRDERGLSPVTIRGQGWHVEKFLGWLGGQNRSFDDVSLEDVLARDIWASSPRFDRLSQPLRSLKPPFFSSSRCPRAPLHHRLCAVFSPPTKFHPPVTNATSPFRLVRNPG